MAHAGGRPRLSEAQKTLRKQFILDSLEPYLKSGLSVNKALQETKIHNSEFYKYMAEDEFFGEKIAKFKQYVSVLLNQTLFNELLRILRKQNGDVAKNILPQTLSQQEIQFLCWYALHARACSEEWGNLDNTTALDPQKTLQTLKKYIDNAVEKI